MTALFSLLSVDSVTPAYILISFLILRHLFFLVHSLVSLLAECKTKCFVSWFYICAFQPLTFYFSKWVVSCTLLSGMINDLQIPSHLPSLEIIPRTILVSRNCETCSLPPNQRSTLPLKQHSVSEGFPADAQGSRIITIITIWLYHFQWDNTMLYVWYLARLL